MKIVVIGGTSAIAVATIKQFAKKEAEILLVDINYERLLSVQGDITVTTGIKPAILEWEISNSDKQNLLFEKIISEFGVFDVAFIAYGTLPVQLEIMNQPQEIQKQLSINFISVATLSSIFADYFEKRNSGTLAVISSVAGDRGRKSNYIYGSAKGGLSIFLQGLRNRLSASGVTIITIKPGLVDSPMTADIPKSPLFSSTEIVGKHIFNAIEKKKDIAYVPGFWRIVMFIIKHIPESIFKKMNL